MISSELAAAAHRGFSAFAAQPPITLEQWAEQHFYLSAESSYVQQRWHAWPYQRAIMACISNDDIEEINWQKSARTGYTKIILAAQAYFAQHKRRNQALWQPTDDDAISYVKTELDPMLRDVQAMRDVFPSAIARHKDNTLTQKKFIGSVLHILGGKAAKNYRRISVDVAYLDELDAFDTDVETEGDPVTLARKRIEGATFPKLVLGSTPGLRGASLIERRAGMADHRFTYQIPCPHCGELHALTFGAPDEPHGFKWDKTPESVRHLCPHCAALITQGEYLAAWESGVWVSGEVHLHADGSFTDRDGGAVPIPRHVAFHTWTAYSPAASWSGIVREFLAAAEAAESGDQAKLKAFRNTTLGETWEGEIERTDLEGLRARAEPRPKRFMPRDCLLLLCGCDVQGNRIEAQVWGYGIGGQMWDIDHRVFFGNPAQDQVWQDLESFFVSERYPHESGNDQAIYAMAIDSQGHHTDAVYAFAWRNRRRRVYAVRGVALNEVGIEHGNRRVGFDWRGRREKLGPVLWHVGTNLAKDRLASRLSIEVPGPGYVNLSSENTDEWFEQLASEDRVITRTASKAVSHWVPHRRRNEVLDMTVYCIWLEERLGLWTDRMRKWWSDRDKEINGEHVEPEEEEERPPVVAGKPRRRMSSNFATRW